ncbi:MAG TPA: hypothetical protein VFA44_13095 [Gaiellaceae bacterium]|nr:hypothetical protein [Gaiellaceae bacterium]
MATKKQRRRREKERRHEYETVYVDETGREIEVDEPDRPRKAPEERRERKQPAQAGQRTIEPPSWSRVLRRASMFAPIMLVVLYLLRPKNGSSVALAIQALVLVILLVPFMYAVDSMAYRSYQRRMAKRAAGSARSGRSSPKTK